MKVKDIAAIIENNAPCEIALGFDNVGLLIGDANADVSGVVVAVDATREVINYAIANHCNMIVTHHPLIFSGLKSIVNGNYVSELVIMAIRNNINIYAAHTNADNAPRGINYCLAVGLGLSNIKVLSDDGTGCYGDINITDYELIARLEKLVKGTLINYGNSKQQINRIALISGSGGRSDETVGRCIELGIDCFITAEVAHNIALQFIDKGIKLIQYGHYESERIFVDIASGWLSSTDLPIHKALSSAFVN